MKTLIVYFSQTGKTQELAEKLAGITGGDLLKIQTKKSYEMSYRKTVFTSLGEIFTKARLELDMEIPDISRYDRILIGAPIWCGCVPNAVYSFLDRIDLSDKKAALFTTSGATTPDKIAEKLKKEYTARWHRPLDGNQASEDVIREWLR